MRLNFWGQTNFPADNGKQDEVVSVGNGRTEGVVDLDWQEYSEHPLAVGEVSLDGFFLRVNQNFCDLLGYSEAELQKLRVRDVTHPEDRMQSVSIVDRALHHIDQSQTFFKRYLHRDGRVLFTLLRTTLKADPEGRPSHFLSFVEDVSQRVQEEPLARAMAQRMQLLREQERQQIARELHDELSQGLTALKLEIAWLEKRVRQENAQRVEHFGQIVDNLMASVKQLWLGLRPSILDELGLEAALDWLLQETCGRAEIAYHFQSAANLPGLDQDTRLALFRIAQEALTNVLRHSGASEVALHLEPQAGALCLTVEDNGVGIGAMPSGTVGLAGIRERVLLLNGELQLAVGAKGGTRLIACLPTTSSPGPGIRVPPYWN